MNVRMVRVLAVACGGLIAAGACSRKAEKDPAAAPAAPAGESGTATTTAATPVKPSPPPKPRAPREPEKTPDLELPLRPLDQKLLAAAKKGLDAKRVASTFGNGKKPPKVALASRPGDAVPVVEIDLEGDGRLDETFRFEPEGRVSREVRVRGELRADLFKLEGQMWKLVSGTGRSATQEPITPEDLRPLHREILAIAAKQIEDVADASPGKPYRIALSKERGGAKVNRAKIDLDRDGAWDEIWWVDPPTVRRDVSPKDDGDYTSRYRLRDGKWYGQ